MGPSPSAPSRVDDARIREIVVGEAQGRRVEGPVGADAQEHRRLGEGGLRRRGGGGAGFPEPLRLEREKAPPCDHRRRSAPAVGGFLGLDELGALLTDARVPPLRRVAYALEFLTGLRPGEVAALRVADVDLHFPPAGRILVARAWSGDNKVEGPTKTKVAKVVPVHPGLWRVLRTGARRGGSACLPSNLLVPAPRGGHRMASQTNQEFQVDLARLGLRKRLHSDSRATFALSSSPPVPSWSASRISSRARRRARRRHLRSSRGALVLDVRGRGRDRDRQDATQRGQRAHGAPSPTTPGARSRAGHRRVRARCAAEGQGGPCDV
jgi:integrase